MKRYFFILCLTGLTFLCAVYVDCSKIEESSEMTKVERIFQAYFDPNTRTSVSSTGKVSWCQGDKIHYYSKNNGSINTYAIDNPGERALIKLTLEEQNYVVAAYGCIGTENTGETQCTLNGAIKSEQIGTFVDAHLSICKTILNGQDELRFKNVASLITFSFNRSDISFITFSSNDGTALHGNGMVNISFDATEPSASYDEQTGSTIKVWIGGKGQYYISTLPCTIAGFTIECYNSDGEWLGEVKSTKTLTLKGNTILDLGILDSRISDRPAVFEKGKMAIIAHRGYWNCEEGGYAKNSVAALKAAQANGFRCSECDLQFTKDGVIIVNHDSYINGKKICSHNFADFEDARLENGEKYPTLDDYLTQASQSYTTMLVIELKTQQDDEHNELLVNKTISKLKEYGMYDPSRIAFIAFDRGICRLIAKEYPQFINQFLDENPILPTKPSSLAEDGINGIDYLSTIFKLYPEYVSDAHNLGMSVNVWTVDKASTAQDMAELGVEAITSNEPMMLRDLLKDKELKR